MKNEKPEYNYRHLIEKIDELIFFKKIKNRSQLAKMYQTENKLLFKYDGNLSAFLNGTKKLSDDFAKWFAEKFDYDIDLIKGDQNILAETLSVNGEIVKAPNGRIEKRVKDGELINFYDVDFAMGDVEFHNDTPAIKPAYTMDIPEFSGCTAFRGYSESMEPLIKSGAILFGTKIEDWRSHLEPGQIYGIIMSDKRRYLKYVRKSVKPDTHFLLRSENVNYDDFEIPKEKIKSIWLIHGWVNKRV